MKHQSIQFSNLLYSVLADEGFIAVVDKAYQEEKKKAFVDQCLLELTINGITDLKVWKEKCSDLKGNLSPSLVYLLEDASLPQCK